MPNPSEVRSELVRAAQKRSEGDRLLREGEADLKRLVPLARQLGIPMAEIARLAGISRPWAYEILKGSE